METLYTKIGPVNLRAIVDRFYDLVFINAEIEHLFRGDRGLVRDKQYQFLTQFLGGPQIYTDSYGHPKMRMRHMPHKITNAAKDEWLKCMHQAIHETLSDQDLARALYDCFPPVAAHMVNQ